MCLQTMVLKGLTVNLESAVLNQLPHLPITAGRGCQWGCLNENEQWALFHSEINYDSRKDHAMLREAKLKIAFLTNLD